MDIQSLITAFREMTDWRTWGPGIAMLGILVILGLRDTISNCKPLLRQSRLRSG